MPPARNRTGNATEGESAVDSCSKRVSCLLSFVIGWISSVIISCSGAGHGVDDLCMFGGLRGKCFHATVLISPFPWPG